MRALQVDSVDLNQVIALSECQARSRYNIGANTLYKISEEAGAVIHIGTKKKLYSRVILDQFFEALAGI